MKKKPGKKTAKKKVMKGYAEGGKVKKKPKAPFGLFGGATAAARKRKLEQEKKSRGGQG